MIFSILKYEKTIPFYKISNLHKWIDQLQHIGYTIIKLQIHSIKRYSHTNCISKPSKNRYIQKKKLKTLELELFSFDFDAVFFNL